MFVAFFSLLRRRGLAVTPTEWIELIRGLALGLAGDSLTGFYYLARALLVKSEDKLDLFDQTFAEFFRGVPATFPAGLAGELLEWLKDQPLPREVTPEEMERIAKLDLQTLREEFEKRLQEQKERHDGGNRWVGTGGTSPFGHAGAHPSGIRVGGQGLRRSAVQIATARRFKNLRSDLALDTRTMSLALKRLRVLARTGAAEELDLDGTIASTAKSGGDLDLVMRASRKNDVRLLLLMDVGGSMTGHARLSERLFSAAHSLNHFKEFRSYYFHNCVYDFLFRDLEREETIPTKQVLKDVDASWCLLIVGDAAMSPLELTAPGGCIDYFFHNEEPGVLWLAKLAQAMPRAVWLNPEPEEAWGITSTRIVRRVFPRMSPLTLEGLTSAVEALRKAKDAKAPDFGVRL